MQKILVIEDHGAVRENIKQLLEKAGYQVLCADNGSDGLKLAFEELPDVIICDIMMPKMNGYEVIKELGSDREASAIPFIFLTARAEMADLRLGMELGADDYLVKPFKAADLLKAIKTRLEKRESIIKLQNDKKQEPALKSSSVIMAGNPPEVLKIASIVYISSQEGYSNVFTKEGKKLLVRKLLKEWEILLPEDHFLRIHNSTIINLHFMERVEKWFNNTLRIYMQKVSEPLEVSKRYAPKIKARLRV